MAPQTHTVALQSLPLKVETSPKAFCAKQEEDRLGQYGSWRWAMLPLLFVGISRTWDLVAVQPIHVSFLLKIWAPRMKCFLWLLIFNKSLQRVGAHKLQQDNIPVFQELTNYHVLEAV